MRHPVPSIARAALALASGVTLLGGCAEIHRGAEAVGRLGSPTVRGEQADAAPAPRPDIKTVRPREGSRATAALSGPEPAPAVVAAVPSPQQIFDFHPPGARPDSWRQPFIIDTSDGPLAADVRRSTAELRAFMADRKAAPGAAADAASGTARRRCGETDVAAAKPGCAVPPAAAASR